MRYAGKKSALLQAEVLAYMSVFANVTICGLAVQNIAFNFFFLQQILHSDLTFYRCAQLPTAMVCNSFLPFAC